jgi:hypothetical protein
METTQMPYNCEWMKKCDIYTLWNLGEEEKEKENDRKSTILKYITSVQVEDIIPCIESC